MVRLSDCIDKMDKEEILDALNRFGKKPTETIPPLLENYLRQVAKTGETWFPWPRLKPLFVQKLLQVMVHFHEEFPADHLLMCPNVENVKFEDVKHRIMNTVESFNGAPFTIQRLCELLTEPMKHYKRSDKFLRGLEKNFRVVSTVDPFGRKIVSESRHLVNGLDINGHISTKADESMNEDTSMFHSPYPVDNSPLKSMESSTATELSEPNQLPDPSEEAVAKDSSLETNVSSSSDSNKESCTCDNTITSDASSEKLIEDAQEVRSECTSPVQSSTHVVDTSESAHTLTSDTELEKVDTSVTSEADTSNDGNDSSTSDALVCRESSDFFTDDAVSSEKPLSNMENNSSHTVESVCPDSISLNKRSSGEFEVTEELNEPSQLSSSQPSPPSSPAREPPAQSPPEHQPQEQESSGETAVSEEQKPVDSTPENISNLAEANQPEQQSDIVSDVSENVIPDKTEEQSKEEPQENIDMEAKQISDSSDEVKNDSSETTDQPQPSAQDNTEQDTVTMTEETSTDGDCKTESVSQDDRMEEPMEED